MSYYESNYYENPGPAYVGGDEDEPVPGWGGEVNMAGPSRVGVGASFAPVTSDRRLSSINEQERQASGGLPWWGWVLIVGALGAGVGIAQNRGYLAKVGLRK